MEIKINKEIRTYKETIFFGLSLRQFICSVLAVGMAVVIYFAFRDVLGRSVFAELLSIDTIANNTKSK